MNVYLLLSMRLSDYNILENSKSSLVLRYRSLKYVYSVCQIDLLHVSTILLDVCELLVQLYSSQSLVVTHYNQTIALIISNKRSL